jgi:protein TonB
MSFPERIRYGASELRRFYNRNLFAALGISIAIHLALIALYLTSTDVVVAGNDNTPIDSNITVIRPFEPPPVREEPPVIPSEPTAPGGGPTSIVEPPSLGDGPARGGDPVPVDDTKLTPDEGKFATTDQISSSNPNGKGNGGDPNGSKNGGGGTPPQGGGGDSSTKAKPVADEIPNEFPDPDVQLPDVNLEDITRRAVYPRMARENGIEGKVTVKVLIDEEGRPMRASIEMGANVLLDSAAIQAVRATRFQPAMLNGEPVKAWLFLPLNFTLD